MTDTGSVLTVVEPGTAHTLTIIDGDSTQVLSVDTSPVQVLAVSYARPGPPGPAGEATLPSVIDLGGPNDTSGA